MKQTDLASRKGPDTANGTHPFGLLCPNILSISVFQFLPIFYSKLPSFSPKDLLTQCLPTSSSLSLFSLEHRCWYRPRRRRVRAVSGVVQIGLSY